MRCPRTDSNSPVWLSLRGKAGSGDFQKTHGMSIEMSNWFGGVSFGGMALVAAIAGWAANRLISRGAEPIFVRRAFTVAGFVMAAMQTLSVFTSSKELMIGLTVASLCGLGLATANYWALTQTLMPGAVPVAIQNTAANLAGIVAPRLTGCMIKQTGSTATQASPWRLHRSDQAQVRIGSTATEFAHLRHDGVAAARSRWVAARSVPHGWHRNERRGNR